MLLLIYFFLPHFSSHTSRSSSISSLVAKFFFGSSLLYPKLSFPPLPLTMLSPSHFHFFSLYFNHCHLFFYSQSFLLSPHLRFLSLCPSHPHSPSNPCPPHSVSLTFPHSPDRYSRFSLLQVNGQQIVNAQYNTPLQLYSEDNIAETLSAQAEVLGKGCLG